MWLFPRRSTGVHQSHISLFEVLKIPTVINNDTVEVINPVELIKKGDRVGSSEAALLAKLGIRPFSYGLVLRTVYENSSVFSLEELEDPSKFDAATSGGDAAPAEEKKEEPAKESFSE